MKNFSSLFIKSSRLRFFDRFERESTLNNSGILSIIVFESKPSSKKSWEESMKLNRLMLVDFLIISGEYRKVQEEA